MATITGNNVYADPTQWWTLDYTFANSKFTWSVTCHASHTSYWNSIYGLTVNVGGNSYYKGDIDWRNYTPNTVVYSGTTNLSDCTVSGGVVTLSVSGNFYYGTWNTDYRSYGSGTCAVDPPTVATLSTPSITNQYSGMTVAGRSVITFRMKGTSQTGSTTMSYSLYQDGSVISTSTGTSGQNKDVTVTAPSAGSHTYKYTATDGNGTSTTSGNVSITTYAYTAPSFTSVSAVRWSTGNSSGTASDTGTYAKCVANFTQGQVGTTKLTTTLTVTVNNTSSTTTTSGTALYMGGGNLSADNSYTVTFGLKDTYVTTTSVTRTDTLTQGGRGIDLVYGSTQYGVALGKKATAGYFDVGLTARFDNKIQGNIDTSVATYSNLASIGKNVDQSTDHAEALKAYFNSYKSSTPRNKLVAYYDSSSGNGSLDFGYFLNGYDANPYGGFYVCHYNVPYYVGIVGGSYQQQKIMTNTQTPSVVTNAVSRSSGWAISSQNVYVWGKMVMVSIVFTSTTSYSAGSNCFTGTLASGYRPPVTVGGASYYGSGGVIGAINSSGGITIRAVGGSVGGTGTQSISFTYLMS